MSNNIYALLRKADVPGLDEWQKAIDASGFDFQLNETLKPFEDSGFLPCKLMGVDAGFEIYYGPIDSEMTFAHELAPNADFYIAFRWGSNMIECASANVASYALAKYCKAVVTYEGEEPHADLDQFHLDTKSFLEEIL